MTTPADHLSAAQREARSALCDLAARDTALGADLFTDPAWAIMLDLYVSAADGRTVSVTDACHAARVPLTTALRHISMLEDRDMIRRQADVRDRRRTNLALTGLAERAMDTHFIAVALRRDPPRG